MGEALQIGEGGLRKGLAKLRAEALEVGAIGACGVRGAAMQPHFEELIVGGGLRPGNGGSGGHVLDSIQRGGRIMDGMKMACALLLLATVAFADEASDRKAIEGVIEAFNSGSTASPDQRAALFTSDADEQTYRLASLDHGMVPGSDRPWSEVSVPRIVIQSLRFVSQDVALVECAKKQYGSMGVRSLPLLFVFKNTGRGWRVFCIRAMVEQSAK